MIAKTELEKANTVALDHDPCLTLPHMWMCMLMMCLQKQYRGDCGDESGTAEYDGSQLISLALDLSQL